MSTPDSETIGERQGARVCAGLFLAALVPAAVVAALGESLTFLPYALVVTGIHTLLLGLPAFLLAYERGWINALTCIGVAFVIGATPMGFFLGWQFVRLLETVGLAWNVKVPATLPPRPGISPVTSRAMSVAASGQALVSRGPA